jgi:formate hydrogenlyase subunit 6/NADH:ubiquinone oxidoreductase subunit I
MNEFRNPYSEAQAAQTAKEVAQKPPRKKAPPKLAIIDQNGCTGCEVCIVFCPVDCIEVVPGADHPEVKQVVEVDLDRCIGCALCAKNCPWETIYMLPHDQAIQQAPAVTLNSVCEQPTLRDSAAR